jgi:hypothetical protein
MGRQILGDPTMKTLFIAAAAATAIASLGAALPASAQTWDRGHVVHPVVRPTPARFDTVRRDRFVSPWEIRRLEERRRIEWQRQHDRFHYGFHDSGYGYRR